jgi:hypothetical protein
MINRIYTYTNAMLIIWHFSLSTPTHGYILQASMFNSPKKSFDLPVYAEAMARASPPTQPNCVPRKRNVDPRVLEFFDIDATVDASFPIDCSDRESSSESGEIFQRRSSKSRPCSDDSMSQSCLCTSCGIGNIHFDWQ